jgi:CHAD domain-containing protein
MATNAPLRSSAITGGLTALFHEKRRVINEECERFVQIGDAESLHDLRVAMRRLHSLFVAFKPAIRADSPFPVRLKQLLSQTNHARDLEVSLAILRNSALQLPWLEQQWQEELGEEYRQLRATLPDAWRELAPALAEPQQLLLNTLATPSLGELAAVLLRRKAGKLKKQRKQLCRQWDDRAAHKLRIRGKQLRYLCEPFAEELAPSADAVTGLKSFQDQLGDYHDIIVLRSKLKTLQQESDEADRQQQLKKARKILKRQRKKLRKRLERRLCRKGGKLERRLKRTASALAKQ